MVAIDRVKEIQLLQDQVDSQGKAIVKVAKEVDMLNHAMAIMSDSVVDATHRLKALEDKRIIIP